MGQILGPCANSRSLLLGHPRGSFRAGSDIGSHVVGPGRLAAATQCPQPCARDPGSCRLGRGVGTSAAIGEERVTIYLRQPGSIFK